MLPGLALTVGLLAQSVAGLVSTAPRDPNTPRFVNIGDEIVQSSTARPVPPVAACEPAPQVAPAPEPQRVIVEVRVPSDQSEMAPAETAEDVQSGIPIDQLSGGVVFVPVVVRRAPHRSLPNGHPFAAPHSLVQAAGRPSLQTVMLPPSPTVLLPPQPTVMLPASRPR